ncbi:MAG: DUF2083 domain-containing protein, partial [bacterium]|nr:DUF2083 domain-containing protein [bacterium]
QQITGVGRRLRGQRKGHHLAERAARHRQGDTVPKWRVAHAFRRHDDVVRIIGLLPDHQVYVLAAERLATVEPEGQHVFSIVQVHVGLQIGIHLDQRDIFEHVHIRDRQCIADATGRVGLQIKVIEQIRRLGNDQGDSERLARVQAEAIHRRDQVKVTLGHHLGYFVGAGQLPALLVVGPDRDIVGRARLDILPDNAATGVPRGD